MNSKRVLSKVQAPVPLLWVVCVLTVLTLQGCGSRRSPLRQVSVGTEVVIICEATEPVTFTGFCVNEDGEATPFVAGHLGLMKGTYTLEDDPPADSEFRLRFAVNYGLARILALPSAPPSPPVAPADGSGVAGPPMKVQVGWPAIASGNLSGVAGPLTSVEAKEIEMAEGVAEYIHTGGKVILRVRVVEGKVALTASQSE